jgi:glycosyltransferase involved in cell wall biosynthesis
VAKKIVIFTQVYNGEKYIARAIDSVLAQTYTDFTYIIIDNNSTDGTADILTRYAAQDSRIEVRLEKENDRNRPFYNAKECAEKYADGYWCMLDADDTYQPEFLEKMLDYSLKNNLDICTCGSHAYYEDIDTTSPYCLLAGDVIIDTAQIDDTTSQHMFRGNLTW